MMEYDLFQRDRRFRGIAATRLVTAAMLLGAAVLTACRAERETAQVRPDEATTQVATTAESDDAMQTTDGELTTAASWPRWRGPDANGISRETCWSTDWPSAGPPVLWRDNVGIGFSSISVADGHLFTMGYRNGQDVVDCLDAATGKKVWDHRYPCELVDNLHEGGPGATPTVDGNDVFTLSREGHLYCLEKPTGRVRWLREFKKEIGAVQPEWGFTSSALIVDDMVVVDVGHVVAVNRQSGETVWKSSKYRAGYGTPVVWVDKGEKRLAVFNNDGVLVLHADSGKELAFEPRESQYATSSTTPIVHGNTIFVSSGYGGGGALLRFQDHRLEIVYENRSMSNHFNNCVLLDGFLYGFDGNSSGGNSVRLVCMAHVTGKVHWQQRGFGCGSLMAADGKLIILGEEGRLAVAKADPDSYQEICSAQVIDGRCWTVPVLAGGRIYCRNAAGDLICLNVAG